MKRLRIFALTMALLTVFSMVACSGETNDSLGGTGDTVASDTESEPVIETSDLTDEAETKAETIEKDTDPCSDTETENGESCETEKESESEPEDTFEIEKCDSELSDTEETTETKEDEMGLDITNKSDLVSICYSVWFDGILGEGDDPVTDFYNISEVLAGRQEWGNEGQFHYWGKPAQGYYRSTDKKAIRNNMTLLASAGIDFIILDYTNANDSYVTNAAHGERWAFAPLRALCETIVEMRAEGKKTPYIVLWCGQSDGALIDAFYNGFYTVEEWQDCFVYWDGKPFMITTKPVDGFPRHELFTVRHMWGLTDEDCWKFLNVRNSRSTVYFNNGEPEQISVAVATQETYMSEPSAHGRNGGRFFYDQWKNAFRFRPKVVTVTWWNEWAAQRFIVDGKTTFVDNYTQEYSRDIEPMEGGHGDLYYRWLCEYVKAYKAGEDCPELYLSE